MNDTDIHGDGDTLDDIEQALGGLPLRRPTLAMDVRIDDALRQRPRRPLQWVGAAAVLILGVTVTWRGRPRPTPTVAPPPPAVAAAVTVERETSAEVDDGVVSVAGRVPYRQVRRRTVREIWWVDPSTGAKLWARVPTEKVTVEPAETF